MIRKNKTFCYFHIYYDSTDNGLSLNILKEMLHDLKITKVIDKLGKVYCFVKYVKDPLVIDFGDEKFVIVNQSNDYKSGENDTIEAIRNDALNNKEAYNVMYIHTKGAAGTRNPLMAKNWRFLLIAESIYHFDNYIKQLENNDIAGSVFLSEAVSPNKISHFSGNFWFATSKYLKKIKPIDDYSLGCQKVVRHSERHRAEFILTYKLSPKVYTEYNVTNYNELVQILKLQTQEFINEIEKLKLYF